ncbi:MAG: formate/nitrite transporter family protein, partial [Gammaproteobacteria bacterium]
MLKLAVVAGVLIAFGGMFFTMTVAGAPFGYGPTRVLGGLASSLGFVLAVAGGAELFTGNNLIIIARANRKITTTELVRNWGLVYVGNFLGAAGCVALMH